MEPPCKGDLQVALTEGSATHTRPIYLCCVRLRLHVFQHVPHEDLAALGPMFEARGASITFTRFFAGERPPEIDAFDFLVVLGGPMGVYDAGEHPWLPSERDVLRAALAAGKPVLGLCLGAQLIADALGARVFANGHREIGWWPVERLPEAANHPVARCFPERFTTFHWHGDTFAIPDGAIPLFRSEACANQGFVWNDRVVALQFHPEITPEAVEAWIAASDGYHLAPGAWIQPESALHGTPDLYAGNREGMKALCDWMQSPPHS